MPLNFLKNFFSSSSANKFSHYKLYAQMRRWRDQNYYPRDYELPEIITFPPDFWKEVIRLYKYTRSDGHERAISIFWADGDLILSSIVKGSTKSVTPRNQVQVKYSQHPTKREYARKEVYVDNKLYSRKDIYYKKIPNSIEVRDLFNMHTHPPHQLPNGNTYYSFFSAQDIKALIQSKAIITGMIGDKLWLLIRTSLTPTNLSHLTDQDISIKYLTETLNIAIYHADFKGKLYRVREER